MMNSGCLRGGKRIDPWPGASVLTGCETPFFSERPSANCRAIKNRLRLPAIQFGTAFETRKLMW